MRGISRNLRGDLNPEYPPAALLDFNDAVFYFTVEGEAYTGAQAVPEPATLLLALLGLALLPRRQRKRRHCIRRR